jgi:muramoyltetrapeptide carboxypeptidase
MEWNPVKKGEVIDIIAPAGGRKGKNPKDVLPYVKSLGLKPRMASNIFGKDLLFANTDAVRFAQLKKALYADDSSMIWCLKGGYGTARLVEKLYGLKPPKAPKLVVGFSDITALHLFLNQEWGWPTVHGSVLWPVAEDRVDARTVQKLLKLIFGKTEEQNFLLRPINKPAKEKRGIKASVVGGNLSLLQCSVGTKWQIDAAGKFLLLEDVDERPYRIDRMLLQLRQAERFKGVKAIFFGDMGVPAIEKKLLESVVEAFANSMNIPCFWIPRIGHAKPNDPMPFNTKAVLSCGAKPTLVVDSGFKK